MMAYDKTYVFVFMHQHPYCAGGHESNLTLRNTLCPLFEDYMVDMVFSGHSHFYQRNGPVNGVTYIIAAGGGAPLYAPAESLWTQYSEKSHHFTVLLVWPDSLKFKMVRTDGSVGDSLIYHAQEKPEVICGDVNGDLLRDLADVIYLANYKLKGGDPPPIPIYRANANGDSVIDLSDVLYIANYYLKDGPAPHDCENYQP